MKTLYWTGFCLLLLTQNTFAQTATEKRVFFPYFRLGNSPEKLSPLPHQNTQVVVQIDGLRAAVTVHQVYKNTTDMPVALSCVIPTDIDAFQGSVAGKVIIRKPNLPKDAYTAPTQALLMPDILAQEALELIWHYAVICEIESDLSVFRLPAFQNIAEGDNAHYDLKVVFHTDLPIKEITSQQHIIEVQQATSNTAEVVFAKEEKQAGTHPFVLRYKFFDSRVNITPKKETPLMRGEMSKEEEAYNATVENAKKEDIETEGSEKIILKYYEVKENDYVEKIAAKFHVTATNIAHWNHLKEPLHLKKGQRLKLEVPCTRITHIVAEDEYPYLIAQLYDVKTTELLQWNNLKDTDRLSIGQKIYIYHVKK